jgi:hypothetical protein
VLITPSKPPAVEDVKKLTITDIAIMNTLAYSLRNRLKQYVEIAPFTMPDPFGEKDGFNFFIIIDKQHPIRIIAMIASKIDYPSEIEWNNILDNRWDKLRLSEKDAISLKNELMPKDTNNFYPYRLAGRIAGYVMFAFQICGPH